MLNEGCILLNFYIKPQHQAYDNPTWRGCILLNFYIKPQQTHVAYVEIECCILLNFYIKPQLRLGAVSSRSVVSY